MYILMLPYRTKGKHYHDNRAYNKICSSESEERLEKTQGKILRCYPRAQNREE